MGNAGYVYRHIYIYIYIINRIITERLEGYIVKRLAEVLADRREHPIAPFTLYRVGFPGFGLKGLRISGVCGGGGGERWQCRKSENMSSTMLPLTVGYYHVFFRIITVNPNTLLYLQRPIHYYQDTHQVKTLTPVWLRV